MKQRRPSPFIAGSLLIGLLALSQTANAQVAPNSSLPGAVIQGSQDPINRKPYSVDVTPNVDTEKSDGQNNPDVEKKVSKPNLDPSLQQKIFIKAIRVEGAKDLTEAEIRQFTAPYEGKEASIEEINDNVADKLTELYEKKGYVMALVFVPPQEIQDGVLVLRAEEGSIGEVVFEKGKYFGSRAVMPRISLDKGDTFQLDDLVRSLRRINENPDLVLRSTLRAGQNPGETVVVIKPAAERFPLHITPFIDNLGRYPLGTERYGVTVQHNNLLGFGDTAFSQNFWTKRSYGTVNGYEIPLGAHGTKLGVTQAHSRFRFFQSDLEFQGRSNFVNPYISQEFFRNDSAIISGELAFGVKNSTFEIEDQQISQDRLRVITPALNAQFFDRFGRTFMRHEFALGVDLFNAGTQSRTGADSQFFRYTASALRTQRLPFNSYGVFKAIGQVTPDRLVSLEQFQVGGAATVRGYPEGRLIGDSGFVLSAEGHVPFFFVPETWKIPRTNYKLRENLELVGFTDFGAVFNNKAASGPGVNIQSGRIEPQAYAWSIGVGIRARLTRLLNARLDFGFPLLDIAPRTSWGRVHFAVESRLF